MGQKKIWALGKQFFKQILAGLFFKNMGLQGGPFFQKNLGPMGAIFSEKIGPRWSKKRSLQQPHQFLTNVCGEITKSKPTWKPASLKK